MGMLDIATVFNVVNVVLLVSLFYVYITNYMKVRTRFGLGLILFAMLLLIRNAVAVYFQLLMIMYYTDEVASFALILNVLETLGLAVLSYITYKP